jgi:hypothetical protein
MAKYHHYHELTKLISVAIITILFTNNQLYARNNDFLKRAENNNKYPLVSGNILAESRSDRILSNSHNIKSNNSFIYIENDSNFHLSKNWQVKTNWRLQPNDVITTRNNQFPERYRTILQNDRKILSDKMGLIAEEIKIVFDNEDMQASFGKFDPTFGNAHSKNKRLGIFTRDITEDYNLREKIGGSLTAFLEDSKISISGFVNDDTFLSESGINNRSRPNNNLQIAGNSSTPSYSINMDGSKFFNINNWFYNFGYRHQNAKDNPNSANERGFTLNSEYLLKIENLTIVPFIEFVNINNFSGEKDRNAIYNTAALMIRYSRWNLSATNINRNLKSKIHNYNYYDKITQFSIGYKFNNNFSIDATSGKIRETKQNANLLGLNLRYIYKF